MPNQKIVDVIGVILDIHSITYVFLKSGVEKGKRTLILADESEKKILVALWGEIASEHDY